MVKVYGYTELWVTFDNDDNVLSAVKERPKELPRKSLKLQFIVMEKISSVFGRTKNGSIYTNPKQLAAGDEQEVLRLASDIGRALQRAHDKNILHRDIKLENVFYEPNKKQYKLGDFGIAKMTKDGFASTVAFTKGYAAPEVRGTQNDDKYDNTADIYSFGIMLFVLMNNLKFPDSNTYSVNPSLQYKKGYVLPRPENASEDFYQIIAKMCMYNPDERYQSVEKALTDIERLMYKESVSYRREHKNSSLIVGTIMLFLGAAACKLTLAPEMEIRFSFWEYIFLFCCLGKAARMFLKKDIILLSMVILGLGIFLLISGGFSWIKLVLLVWLTFSSGMTAGFLSSAALTFSLSYAVGQQSSVSWEGYRGYSWLAVSLLSLSIVLLYQYLLLVMDDKTWLKRLYNKGVYWIFFCLLYGVVFLRGYQLDVMGLPDKPIKLLYALYDMGVDYCKVGISGLVFCAFWIIRERVLIWSEKRFGKQFLNHN